MVIEVAVCDECNMPIRIEDGIVVDADNPDLEHECNPEEEL